MIASLLTSCVLFPDRGTRIANDIRGQESPLVANVHYSGDDDESGPSLTVQLVEGATRDDGQSVACEIIWPAIQRAEPPERLVFTVVDSSGLEALVFEEFADEGVGQSCQAG